MSFSAAWLALREPADRAARDPGLLAAAADLLTGEAWAVDLGCGTGATARAFAALAPGGARWRLVDRDRALLAEARARLPGAVETFAADLGDLDGLPLAGARLVTASALLDLMPAAWIDALAERLAASGIAAYAALSYDGRLGWTPALDLDQAVRRAFNAHQTTDKGLGPALGPAAAAAFADAMARRGFFVRTAPSPWRLGPDAAALQHSLIDGIAEAAGAAGLAGTGAWAQARRAASGSGSVAVGHLDVLALPPGVSTQSKITSVASP